MELRVEYQPAYDAASESVGTLYQDARGTVYFEYATTWRSGARELSPLYLPNRTAGAVTTPTPQAGELFGIFQDALPDWWGEQMMRSRFAELGIPWSKVTSLRKLSCQGDRKMGALKFSPVLDGGNFTDHLQVEIEALVQAARDAMSGETTELLEQLVSVGMSPGGARPKALVHCSPDFSEMRIDETAGFTPWLLKFDIDPELQEGRIEAAYAAMARAAGIHVPQTQLLETIQGCHFLSRRFDRGPHGERLHLHSFSGLTHQPLHFGLEYGDLMNLARELTGDHRVVEEIFRRAVFNVAAANDDDHGRNHAFLMDAGGGWSLAPAYDLTLATYPLASGFRAARINGKARDITRADLTKLGKTQAVRAIDDTIDQVRIAINDWNTFASDVGLTASTAAMVRQQMPGFS